MFTKCLIAFQNHFPLRNKLDSSSGKLLPSSERQHLYAWRQTVLIRTYSLSHGFTYSPFKTIFHFQLSTFHSFTSNPPPNYSQFTPIYPNLPQFTPIYPNLPPECAFSSEFSVERNSKSVSFISNALD